MRHRNARVFRPVLVLLALALLAGCGGTPERADAPASSVDLQRFMGTWYVIARIPNMLERGHMASRDEYSLREDGKVNVHYVYSTGPEEAYKVVDAIASVEPNTGNREWKMRFFRVVPTRQRILEVAPDGSWALIDSPGRDLAWIFSRTRDMDDAKYLALRKRLKAHDIDTDKVWRVPQTAEQVGKRGYDVPKSE